MTSSAALPGHTANSNAATEIYRLFRTGCSLEAAFAADGSQSIKAECDCLPSAVALSSYSTTMV
jgi:hypothetical protein